MILSQTGLFQYHIEVRNSSRGYRLHTRLASAGRFHRKTIAPVARFSNW